MANPRNYPDFPDGEADIERAYTALRDAVSADVQALVDKLDAGANGIFTTVDSKTVTVEGGITTTIS